MLYLKELFTRRRSVTVEREIAQLLIKTAGPKLKTFGKALRIASTVGGLGAGTVGIYMAHKGRQERKRLGKATSRAVGILARETSQARRHRNVMQRALVANMMADRVSRRALARAIAKNYAGDIRRGRILSGAIGKNYQLDKRRAAAVLKLHGVRTRRSN